MVLPILLLLKLLLSSQKWESGYKHILSIAIQQLSLMLNDVLLPCARLRFMSDVTRFRIVRNSQLRSSELASRLWFTAAAAILQPVCLVWNMDLE